MKRIYIYLPESGDDYSEGARAELSDKANGNVYAFASSPCIDELWEDFQERVARHGMKVDWAGLFMAELGTTLMEKKQVPFMCLRKLNDTQWDCTERCIVGNETAQEIMR